MAARVPTEQIPAAEQQEPSAEVMEQRRQIARFKELTEQVLPALAREQGWPIRFDHCFKRICLDHAFADVWYNHLPRPAERHIQGEALESALRCAEDIALEGLPLLRQRDQASLHYRGKRPKGGKGAS